MKREKSILSEFFCPNLLPREPPPPPLLKGGRELFLYLLVPTPLKRGFPSKERAGALKEEGWLPNFFGVAELGLYIMGHPQYAKEMQEVRMIHQV